MLLNKIYSATQVNNLDAFKKHVELLVQFFFFYFLVKGGLTFLEP